MFARSSLACINLLKSRVLDSATSAGCLGTAAPLLRSLLEADTAASQPCRGFASPPPLAVTASGRRADRMLPLYNLDRAQVGECALPGDVFDLPVRVDLLHRVVRWQRAKKQQGTHSVKTRAEVRGGGRKPHPQKGTGRARAGTIRAPQWRGGGIAHGPVVRSHAHKLNRKVRRLGLLSALSAKAAEGRLILVDSLDVQPPKTAILDGHLDKLLAACPRRSVLMIDTEKTGLDGGDSIRKAASNLPWVDVLPQLGLNVYSILQRDQLVLTKPALEAAVERLRRPIVIRGLGA